jgi:hypothetical protein
MACPIDPQIPATNKRIKNDIKSILRSLSPLQFSKADANRFVEIGL